MQVGNFCNQVLSISTCESLENWVLPISVSFAAMALAIFVKHHFRVPESENLPKLQKLLTFEDVDWDLKEVKKELRSLFESSSYPEEGIWFQNKDEKLCAQAFQKKIESFVETLSGQSSIELSSELLTWKTMAQEAQRMVKEKFRDPKIEEKYRELTEALEAKRQKYWQNATQARQKRD